ncbi:hypothetical protein [Flavobacterium sp.]|uniref:hypothetical protein n=1 Tax=Flavobacterium sp. TaxID=239 RepID=UPI0033400F30
MNKTLLVLEIAAELQAYIQQIENSVKRYKLATDLDDNDTLDPEDYARQSEAAEMQLRYEQLLRQAKEMETFMREQHCKKYTIIQLRALVETETYYIYVGISIPTFKWKDKTVITLSEKAPAYAEMRGKKAGDTIEFGAKRHKILAIS